MDQQETTSTEAFVAIPPLYDMLMTGVPYADWVAYLDRILKIRRVSALNVLDLACGTGNVTEILVRRGWRVTGADISKGMIAEARRKALEHGLSIAYEVQDAAELDLNGRRFELCVCLFDSLNNILDPERLSQAMHRVWEHLKPGGLFVFDLNTEYALRNHFFDQHCLEPESPLRYRWRSEFDPETRVCEVKAEFWHGLPGETISHFIEWHRQYAYRRDEIEQMLEQAGFEQVQAYQAYTLRAPGRAADRIHYVARRPRSGTPEPQSPGAAPDSRQGRLELLSFISSCST